VDKEWSSEESDDMRGTRDSRKWWDKKMDCRLKMEVKGLLE
jgi:hypothetical protein